VSFPLKTIQDKKNRVTFYKLWIIKTILIQTKLSFLDKTSAEMLGDFESYVCNNKFENYCYED